MNDTATLLAAERAQALWYCELLRRAIDETDNLALALIVTDVALSMDPMPPEGMQFGITKEVWKAGEKRQGPSGRWFVKNKAGRIVPCTPPEGTHPDRRWPRCNTPDEPAEPLSQEEEDEIPPDDEDEEWIDAQLGVDAQFAITAEERRRRQQEGHRWKTGTYFYIRKGGKSIRYNPSPEERAKLEQSGGTETTPTPAGGPEQKKGLDQAKAESMKGEVVQGHGKGGRRVCYQGGKRRACPRPGKPPARAAKVKPDLAGWQAVKASLEAGQATTLDVATFLGTMQNKDLQVIRKEMGGKYAAVKAKIVLSIRAKLGGSQPQPKTDQPDSQPPAKQESVTPSGNAHAVLAQAMVPLLEQGHGQVLIADLAEATKLPLPQLHALIDEMRRGDILSGDPFEGRAGTPLQKRRELAAAIDDHGTKITTLTVRDPEKFKALLSGQQAAPARQEPEPQSEPLSEQQQNDLITQHSDAISKQVARRLRGAGILDADTHAEVASLVTEKLIQSLRAGKFDPSKGKFGHYAARAASNAVAEWLANPRNTRRQPIGGASEEGEIDVASWEPSAEDQAAAQERMTRLHGAIGSLPGRQRDIITMHLQGLSQTDIAGKLGVTPSAINQQHKKALLALRGLLGEE